MYFIWLLAIRKNNSNKKQVILFGNDGGYYLFDGNYLTDNQNAIDDIKKVIETFKRKK